jgi:DNA-directed RNA polymerase subunit beta'
MQQKKGKVVDTSDFDEVVLRLASPERILEWSWGEVKKPETINYRTQRSEKDGLFDEKIFGPERDFECYCGKYKGIRFRGIVCEKCGVEVTRSIVRRERMGHIELSSPVAHIWFLRSVPSRIALILGVSATDAEKVVYFAGYIITKVSADERNRLLKELDNEYKTKLKTLSEEKAKTALRDLMMSAKSEIESIQAGRVLDELTYHKYSVKYGTLFEAGIGAEALYQLFKKVDLDALAEELEKNLETAGAAEREKLGKRLSLVRAMRAADVRPEWMFLTRIPVTPPALRPMVALEGGRHATSDVNDLYRRVINRNNRLKKLKDIGAPEVILRNEKRILQEAVDALLDNSIRRGNAALQGGGAARSRPLKSLADYLKSKQGYFRQNLLGKRVDYSGRSVIVVGPDLKLDQCGLPKHMALELFRPFVIGKLLSRELAFNIRGAGRLIEEGVPEVWAILEEVIEGKYVLLNRAPTLHRQGIQAFRPVLVEGDAIQLHPLVCPAFNADFDGDQMAVHVPLSDEAQAEAREIMSASKNILKPGSGSPVVATDKDIVLGIYWMTKIVEGERGEGKYFGSPNAAILAYDFGLVGFRARVKVKPTPNNPKYAQFKDELFETTVGRLLFNSVLPKDYPYLNTDMKKKGMNKLVDELIERYGIDAMPGILDKIKRFGFVYATRSGVTWSISDVTVPSQKDALIAKAAKEVAEVAAQYDEGLLSEEEKRRIAIEIWHRTKGELEKLLPETLDKNGSVYDLMTSGARGTMGNLTQMAGMKGLIQNTKGEVMEFPIISSMKEGLSPLEYFVSTHGSRKGLADTALKTARAGYLTRRLFDVAQDVIVSGEECGTKEGIMISRMSASGIEQQFAKVIEGRVLAKDIEGDGGAALFKKNHFITPVDARAIDASGVPSVFVRSPMTCASRHGVCQRCYGADLTTHELVDQGEAVGTIAAQAIGEPGTQLTMRTFHAGGTATIGGDITQGLPRVEEIFDKRPPKSPAIVSQVSGEVIEVRDMGREKVIVVLPDAGSTPAAKKKGKKDADGVMRESTEYTVAWPRTPLVKKGARVEKGMLISDGSANIDELFETSGRSRVQDYIISEVSKVYELQGASTSRKHMEIIVKQMFSRRRIADAGDSQFVVGEIVELWELDDVNAALEEKGLRTAAADETVLGITDVSLTRKSFLSAASFQHTTRILIAAALRGSTDPLAGLKENVIIGRLIPAGSGFKGSVKHALIDTLKTARAKAIAEAEAQAARDAQAANMQEAGAEEVLA